jgi:hypothetical protein
MGREKKTPQATKKGARIAADPCGVYTAAAGLLLLLPFFYFFFLGAGDG